MNDYITGGKDMSKIKLEYKAGPSPILGVYPTILIGTMVEDKPDFTAVAWTGVAASVPPTISIALQHHRHSLKGIRRNMTFSVNIPSTEQTKETDYCGLVTGAVADKVKDCHFKVFYGKLETVPFIEQCPINHACEVVQILNLGSHELVVGRIVETYVAEECLTDGRPDVKKTKPILFAGRGYYGVGEYVGEAFGCGKEINPAVRLDTLEEMRRTRKE
jgi:flavin reductase (DIM6/NTAB) family NADH-FMN oxidoreductase RutF